MEYVVLAKKYTAQFNQIIAEVFDDTRNLCSIKYRGSSTIYGVPFDDLFQQAIEALLKQVVTLTEEKTEAEIKSRLNAGYVKKSICQNFDNAVGMANRHRKPRIRLSNLNWIKEQYYPDEVGSHDFEEVEVAELFKILKGKTKAFVRMMERGETITQVTRKLGLSMRQFYKVQANIQKLLKRHGFHREIEKDDGENLSYR